MDRWICGLVLALTALVVGPAESVHAQTAQVSGAKIGTLKTYVPTNRDTFVVHGTIAVPPQPFTRRSCPYVVVDPDGRPLVTQWERVARLQDWMIVELSAYAENPGNWSGRETFEVFEGSNPFFLSGYDTRLVNSLFKPETMRMWIRDHADRPHFWSLTSGETSATYHRLGPNRVTLERSFDGPFGGVQTWVTLERGSDHMEVVINWNNGTLPADPDLFFRSVALEVPGGWKWTPLLPDPAMEFPVLVRRGQHVLPQRWERPFRLIVHPADETPDLSRRGWGVSDWSGGAYMAQSLEMPDLSHTTINLTPKKDDDFWRLENVEPTAPGSVPVNFLYPAQGVYYGGMTGGVEIYQFPEIPLAWSGQPDGLLSTLVEQLRYASRHPGCLYEPNGKPIVQEAYLNPDGTQPWDLFNNEFIGFPPKDQPFGFTQTGPGQGSASYNPNEYLAIDYQHYTRRTKANKALVWLDNDPLAKRYLMMDAELGRMCHYEGPEGRLVPPNYIGAGTHMGRGQAWVGDALAHAYAVGSDSWRARHQPWFDKFVDILRDAQMPNKMFSAQNHGKTATSPPYGNGHTAYYWVHRTNEQIFMMHAMRGIQETVGIDCSDLIRSCGQGIWDFAWKVGIHGPLDSYPAGPVGGPRYATRDEIPDGLTDPVVHDTYHVANAMAFAHLEGASLLPALFAYTQETDLVGAKDRFERWYLDNIYNRAAALSLLQKAVP